MTSFPGFGSSYVIGKVGEPSPCADLVDVFLDLLRKCGVLLGAGVSIAPALLVEIAPSVKRH
jgi:hypothetical protein